MFPLFQKSSRAILNTLYVINWWRCGVFVLFWGFGVFFGGRGLITVCITWGICVALTSSWQQQEHDSAFVCVCAYMCVCWWDAHTPLHRHACGWLECFVPAVLSVKRKPGLYSIDLKSVSMHLNGLACVWTNCVGMMYQQCFAFLCPFEIKGTLKKKMRP